MRKLVICVVIMMTLAGLAACSRSANDMVTLHYSSDLHWYEVANMREQFGLQDSRRGLFGFSRTGSSAPMPAAAPESEWFHLGDADVASDMAPSSGQVEWEDIAGIGQRHVIQTANVELETEYFSDVVAELRQLAPAANGYIESSMETTRGRQRFTIVLRIPAANFETVLRQVENLANVRFSNQWAQDVTDQFYDMVGSLEIRLLEEERVLALIDESQTVQELLALEQRLGNIRLSIETYLSQLNNMAGQIAYSTISVTLFDISEIQDAAVVPTLGERVGGAFGDSVDGTVNALQNIVVFLAGIIVPLILLGLAGAVVYLITRGKVKKDMNA